MTTRINNKLKLGVFALFMLAFSVVSAQTTDQTDGGLVKDAGDGVSVKLIDNKGTIKYLQTNNGITSITSTTAGSATTTTWQLGGALTDDTFINATGQVFGITGIKALDPVTNTVTDIPAVAYDATGFTLMVRDEATGEIKKMLATDLINSGSTVDTAVADEETADEIVVTSTGMSNVASKVWVYRNGAKLIEGIDFVVAADQVTVTGTADWALYTGDVIEVQWIK